MALRYLSTYASLNCICVFCTKTLKEVVSNGDIIQIYLIHICGIFIGGKLDLRTQSKFA